MLTEKTAHCFYGCNFPIILSGAGAVAHLRQLGLDVFDDIVDHSYDLEPDPVHRIELVIQQIKKICELTDLDSIRKHLAPRFLKNITTLKDHTNHQIELPQWKKAFFG